MGENIYKMVQKKQAKKTVIKSGGAAAKENSLFKKCPRNFRIGGDIQPQRDLTRFVKWPKYIRIQRQKRILMQRLKVPPSIAQFANTVDKSQSANLLKLLSKYSPETKRPRTTDSRLLLTPMPRPEPSPSSSSSVSTTLPNSLKTVPPSSLSLPTMSIPSRSCASSPPSAERSPSLTASSVERLPSVDSSTRRP